MVFPGLTSKSDANESICFYEIVAHATNLPILLYNNPQGYEVDLTPDLVAEIIGRAPTVEAIKEESYDTTRVTDLRARFGNQLAVVCGVDNLLVESVALGAHAWVYGMANAVPKQCVTLIELANKGDFIAATQLYRAWMPILHLDVVAKLLQHIKLAESLVKSRESNEIWLFEASEAPLEKVIPRRLPLAGSERISTINVVKKCSCCLGGTRSTLASPHSIRIVRFVLL